MSARVVIVVAISLFAMPAMGEVRVLFAPDSDTDWRVEGRVPLTGSLNLNVGWYGINEERDNVMLGCIPAASARDLAGLCIRQDANWADLSAQGFSVSVEQLVRIGAIDFFGRVSVTDLDIRTRDQFDMQPDRWRQRIAIFGGGARWYPTTHDWGLQAIATRSLDRETMLSAGFFIGF